jgi:hypothetical protein
MFESIANQPEANGIEDHGRNPQRMETILRLPDTTVAGTDCEGKAIADKMPIDQCEADSDPVNEGDLSTIVSLVFLSLGKSWNIQHAFWNVSNPYPPILTGF